MDRYPLIFSLANQYPDITQIVSYILMKDIQIYILHASYRIRRSDVVSYLDESHSSLHACTCLILNLAFRCIKDYVLKCKFLSRWTWKNLWNTLEFYFSWAWVYDDSRKIRQIDIEMHRDNNPRSEPVCAWEWRPVIFAEFLVGRSRLQIFSAWDIA